MSKEGAGKDNEKKAFFRQILQGGGCNMKIAIISDGSGARLVIIGHTHRPFVREICGTVFINPGSVGRPFDGDPRACFGITEISERVNVLIKRVEYDIERNIRELIAAGLPPEIGSMLRNGRDTHIA